MMALATSYWPKLFLLDCRPAERSPVVSSTTSGRSPHCWLMDRWYLQCSHAARHTVSTALTLRSSNSEWQQFKHVCLPVRRSYQGFFLINLIFYQIDSSWVSEDLNQSDCICLRDSQDPAGGRSCSTPGDQWVALHHQRHLHLFAP